MSLTSLLTVLWSDSAAQLTTLAWISSRNFAKSFGAKNRCHLVNLAIKSRDHHYTGAVWWNRELLGAECERVLLVVHDAFQNVLDQGFDVLKVAQIHHETTIHSLRTQENKDI